MGTQNSRNIPPLNDIHTNSDRSVLSGVSSMDTPPISQSMSVRSATDFEDDSTPYLLNQQLAAAGHKYRGKGGLERQNSGKNDQKYDYAASGGLFQRKKAVPTATQFGNVWELNFSPMSRMAYSNSKQRPNRKKKQIKYKSGHVRRETRLKKAFEKMKQTDLKDIDLKDIHHDIDIDNKKRMSDKSKGTPISPRSGIKSKSKETYSKYKN